MNGWWRLTSLVATAAIGIGGAWAIWAHPDAPRWTIAASGVLIAAGGAAALILLVVGVAVIAEDVRPTLRFRKPVVPMSLAHREASLVGRKRYRLHPIKFWGGITLNSRFALVFMLFDQPEYIDFKDAEDR